jgi:hypothetical protein
MSEPLDWNAKTIAEFQANEGRVGGTSPATRGKQPESALFPCSKLRRA